MGISAAEIEITSSEITINLHDKAKVDGQSVEPGQLKWESGTFILLGDTLISYRLSTIRGPWFKPTFAAEQTPADSSEDKDHKEDNVNAAIKEGDHSSESAS